MESGQKRDTGRSYEALCAELGNAILSSMKSNSETDGKLQVKLPTDMNITVRAAAIGSPIRTYRWTIYSQREVLNITMTYPCSSKGSSVSQRLYRFFVNLVTK